MAGLEPATYSLPWSCSTTELHRQIRGGQGGICTPEGVSHLVYSQVRLSTSVPTLKQRYLITKILIFQWSLSVFSATLQFFCGRQKVKYSVLSIFFPYEAEKSPALCTERIQ